MRAAAAAPAGTAFAAAERWMTKAAPAPRAPAPSGPSAKSADVPTRQRSASALQGAIGNRAFVAALGAPDAGAAQLTMSDPGGPAESFADATVARVFGPRALPAPGTRAHHPRAVSPALAELIADARGRGAALPPALRSAMEAQLGGNHAAVRVHVGDDAARAAASLGARAFTSGKDVFFGDGAWQPELPAGRALLAHELVHTMRDAGSTETIFRLTDEQGKRLRQQLSTSSARHRAVVSVALGSDYSDPLDTLGKGKTQLEALQESLDELPPIWVAAATGKRATLSFLVSDTVTEDSAVWLEKLAAARGWKVEAFVPLVGSQRGWPALEAAAADNQLVIKLSVDKSYPAPGTPAGGATSKPAATKPAALPPSGAAAIGHFAKTTQSFDLMSSTGADRELIGGGPVPKDSWVRIDGVDGEAYRIDDHGRPGVAHRSWVRVDPTIDEAGVEADEAARAAEVLRQVQEMQASRLKPKHPLIGRFAQANRVQDIRASTDADAEVVDRLPKHTWVRITGIVDPEAEALEIDVPSTGRSGVTSRYWVDPKTDDEAAQSGDEDVVRLLEPDEMHEEEDDGPSASAGASQADEFSELLDGVDYEAVVANEVALYELDESKLRRGAELTKKKDRAGPPPSFNALEPSEQDELSELSDWAKEANVSGIAQGFLTAFEKATRGIGHNVIDAVESKVLAQKRKLATTAAALHRAPAMYEARKAHHEVKESLEAERKGPRLNPPPIASEPGAQQWAAGAGERAKKRRQVANAGRDQLRSLANIYPFAGEEYEATQNIDWWAFGATRSEEDVVAVLEKDIAAREESIAKAREFLDKEDSIYSLDLLLARSQEVFGIEEGSVPASVLKFATNRVAAGKFLITFFEVAINFIPGGIWVKAAKLVAGLVFAAKAYEEHYQLVAAQNVGLASQEPNEVWLWMNLASAGFDVADLVKGLGGAWRTAVKATASMDPADGRAAAAALDQIRELAAERRALKDLLEDDTAYKEALATFNAVRKGSAGAGLPYMGGAGNELIALAYHAAKRGTLSFRKWLVELKAAGAMRAAAKSGGIKALRAAWKDGKAKALAEAHAARPPKGKATIGARKAAALAAVKKRPPPAFTELETALTKKGLSPEDKALIQGYGPAISKVRVARDEAADGLVDELLAGIEPGYSEAAHRVFRRKLRAKMLEDILRDKSGVARTPGDSRKLLGEYVGELPDSASKGALFGAYREASLGNGALEHVKPLANMRPRAQLAAGARGPGTPAVTRNADGAVHITKKVGDGPPPGVFAAEDKAGSSFNPEQAHDYATAVGGGQWIVPGTNPPQTFEGMIYFFQESKTAEAALDAMTPPSKFARVHVGYFAPDGTLKWLR
jgi:hypothetical protein